MRKLGIVAWAALLPVGCGEGASAQVGDCPQDCAVPPVVTPDLLPRPFAPDSIWNRPIPADAEFADVSGALFGDPGQIITRVGLDIVIVCYTDPSEPLVSIEKNMGWDYPDRACSSGQVLYSRHLAADACIGVSWVRNGNALFNIIDPATGLADEGLGAWRCPGGPFLALLDDDPSAHNIDIINGDGLVGEGRASGVASIGGAVRQGELNNGIPHAVAVAMNARRYSEDLHFIWPASQADGHANDPVTGYHGPDPRYTTGTLLAIPPQIDLSSLAWNTPQGLNMAVAAQTYGWYLVDDSATPDLMHFAMEARAALVDIGYVVDPVTGFGTNDPLLLDDAGFNADMMAIQSLVQAVVSNAPDWTNDAANPVVAGDPSSSWMQAIGDPAVMKDGALYKMWFGANVIDGITQIGYATSADGVSWTLRPEPVLQVGGPGTWDRMSAETPAVIKNADGTYELWYSGLGALESDPNATLWDKLFKIGRATSPDGINWTKDAANPVMDIALDQPTQWDSVVVADPHVIKEGNTYKMWYTGVHVQGTEMVLQIGYATSPDGTAWTRYAGNPVFTLGAAGSWDSNMVAQPGVFSDGQTLIMLYMGNDGSSIGDEGATGNVGLAFSSDGINWQRSANPILRKGGVDAWNQVGVWGPTGMFDDGVNKIWYTGVTFIGEQIHTGVGFATSAKRPPTFPTVPTVSTWGLAMMTLLLLTAGTVVMPLTFSAAGRRRRNPAQHMKGAP